MVHFTQIIAFPIDRPESVSRLGAQAKYTYEPRGTHQALTTPGRTDDNGARSGLQSVIRPGVFVILPLQARPSQVTNAHMNFSLLCRPFGSLCARGNFLLRCPHSIE